MPAPRDSKRVHVIRAAVAVASFFALISATSRARAADTNPVTETEMDPATGAAVHPRDPAVAFLSPGPLLSFVGGKAHATGIGFEIAEFYYPAGRIPSFGYGPLVQAQLYDGKWFRGALGGELSVGPFGLELGVGFRQTDGQYASTFSSHTAQFLSLGYFSIAVRESIAVVAFPSNMPSYAFETAFAFTLKLPITLFGRDPTGLTLSPWSQ